LVTPPQALLQKEFVDAAALDRDPFLLVEVGLQTIKRPAAEGQSQVLRGRQRGGDDLGTLLGRVGVRPARSGAIIETGEALLVEAMDPGVDVPPTDVHLLGDGTGALPCGGGQKDPGTLDEAGRCGPGVGQLLAGMTLLGGQGAERDLVSGWHGCISMRGYTLSTSGRWRRITCRMHH
jgi:hypothetical protein